jgi:hypothetical protein
LAILLHRYERRPIRAGSVFPALGLRKSLILKLPWDASGSFGKCTTRPVLYIPFGMVRARGLEPPPLAGPDPKSGASAIPPRAPPAATLPAITVEDKPVLRVPARHVPCMALTLGAGLIPLPA